MLYKFNNIDVDIYTDKLADIHDDIDILSNYYEDITSQCLRKCRELDIQNGKDMKYYYENYKRLGPTLHIELTSIQYVNTGDKTFVIIFNITEELTSEVSDLSIMIIHKCVINVLINSQRQKVDQCDIEIIY